MINLVPPQAKKVIKKEYWLRVGGVWLFTLAVVITAVACLLLPTYVLLSLQIRALELEVERTQVEGQEEYAEALRAVQDANVLATQLAGRERSPSVSKVLEEVVGSTGGTITLFSFTYEQEGEEEHVAVTGRASTRQALVAFADTLEGHAVFRSAHVPVSDLAPEVDLPFTITLDILEAE